MEFFLIYLFVMSSEIAAMMMTLGQVLLIPTAIALVVSTVICVISGIEGVFEEMWNSEVMTFIKRLAKWCIPIGLSLIVFSKLIPNEKQLAIIVGSGVAYNVLTSEPAQRIGGKALELLQKKIEDALKEEDNNGSQTKEEKEIEQAPKHGEAPKSSSQKLTQGAST